MRFSQSGGSLDSTCARGCRGRALCAALLACCALLAGASFGPPNAGAATVTLGSSLSALPSTPFGAVATAVQTVLPGRTLYAPFNGTVTSWQVTGASGGPLILQVVHPLPDGTAVSTGSDVSDPLTGLGVLTFQADLPIREGDMIGIRPTAGADTLGFGPSAPPNLFYIWLPPLADGGAARPPNGTMARELGFNATVLSNCVVPKLLNKKLGAAKQAVEKAGCTTGKVTRPKRKAARKRAKFVRKQKPKAGAEVRGETAVELTLGKKKKKKKKKKR